MRRLIISNTHYQTIVAIQLKMTRFRKDEVVLLISDHSRGADQVAERLRGTGIFQEVYYIISRKTVYEYGRSEQWEDFFALSFLKNNRYAFYLNEIGELFFDELLVFNYGPDIYAVYGFLQEYNRDLVVSMFEEGILSYAIEEKVQKKILFSQRIRQMKGKKRIDEAQGVYYCFYPSLYHGKYKAESIPPISGDSPAVGFIREAFGVTDSDAQYRGRKYLFFTGVYDFEGGDPIGEFELVKRVADLVGKENLLIKAHPRDTRTVFQDYGLEVDRNSAVPWEAVQLSSDFFGHVFLTVASGSVLGGNLMSRHPCDTWFLFDLCRMENNIGGKVADSIRALLNNREMKNILGNIRIARDLRDIL